MYSIVIPAYNEERNILHTLKSYYGFFKKNYKKFEFIVVCDGCTDNTSALVRNFGKRRKEIKLLLFDKKLGKGGGVIEGFRVAKGDVIGFTDADGSTSAKDFGKILNSLSGYDFAIGSRAMSGSEVLIHQPLQRKFLGKGFIIFVNLLFGFGISDTQCGAKVFKRYALKNVINDIKITGFSFDVELIYRLNKKGYKLIEVPILWVNDDDSKVKLRHVFDMGISLLKIRFFGS